MAQVKKILSDEDLINEFMMLELLCDQIKVRCYKARKTLSEREPVAAPAPSGGARVLTLEQEARLIAGHTRRMMRKTK